MELSSLIPTLPLTDPVLIFSVVLLVILLTPLIFGKLNIPHIVGFIAAGILLGENGLGVVSYDSSFQLFGQVGMLYIMFIAGIDMDMNDFAHNRNKSLVFGSYTFIIPVLFGLLIGFGLMYSIFGSIDSQSNVMWVNMGDRNATIIRYSIFAAVVLSSMFASNTLLAYPIVTRYGVSRNRSVTITVGGTMISMLLSLVVLAIVLQLVNGDMSASFWMEFILSLAMYFFMVFYIFPKIASWFFRHHADNILQYIFVLGLVMLSSFLAKLAGMEYIIGAFLAGISINRLIPKRSPLMNRIHFVGNALFIPFFLIGVGMIVDIKLILSGYLTIVVALIISVGATISKYLAAKATALTYKMNRTETLMMFGLSNAKAAYSLVAVMLAYNCVIGKTYMGEDVRLLTSEILNGTVIMILFTCIISSFVTERASRTLASTVGSSDGKAAEYSPEMRILLPISDQPTLEKLMELAVILNDKRDKQPMYALNVVDYQSVDSASSDTSDKLLGKAVELGAASDNKVKKIKRYDLNVASGITNVIREKNISDVVMGISSKATLSDTLFGSMYETILDGMNRMMYVVSSVQPISLTNRILLVIPDGASGESGHKKWCHSVHTIASQSAASVVVYASKDEFRSFNTYLRRHKPTIKPIHIEVETLSIDSAIEEMEANDMLIVVASRKHSISYHSNFDGLIKRMAAGVKYNSFIIIYPEQFKEGEVDRLQDSTTSII